MDQPAKDVLDILVAKHVLSDIQANTIRERSITEDSSVNELLQTQTNITPVDIAKAQAELNQIPFVTLLGKAISPEVSQYIPEAVARRYYVVPFAYTQDTQILSVAFDNPLDTQLIDFLTKKSNKKIDVFQAERSDILSTLEAVYTQKMGEDVTAALKETNQMSLDQNENRKTDSTIRDAPIAQIVSSILEQSVHSRASDIHIEPRETDTRIRFRVDGMLQERLILPHRLHDAVISRIKILSDLKIDEKRIPQDGRFNYRLGESDIDLRVSTLPTVHGEKIVMRLLKKTGGIPPLSELGLDGLALKNLEKNILRPHGIILITGPTGSGKTTTLYSILNTLNKVHVNIMTLEDPVEYEISGINQVQINPQAGLSFATGLRSFLRQDPNIILVGEIRDTETADLAIQAALTGHLVFSTLHTNNAAGAIPRLLDMGAEPFLVASALNAIVGQRIVRRICTTCRKQYTPDVTIQDAIRTIMKGLLPVDQSIELYKNTGKVDDNPCPTCSGNGYLGRVGIFEVLPISEVISKLILTRTSMRDIEKQAVSEGMITLKQNGYTKATRGITTVEEVLRVAEE
jgi:type IV pilus assembly protein PilB